MTALSINYIN